MHKRKTLRRRNTIAAIAVGSIMLGGAGFAVAGEASDEAPAARSSAPAPAASGLAVGTVAEATDAVLKQLGDGRVTSVAPAREGGRTVWKATVDRAGTTSRVTLDATTGKLVGGAGSTTGTGAGRLDDDDDDSDDDSVADDNDDDGDDDDDDGEQAGDSDDDGDDDQGDSDDDADDSDDDDGGPIRGGVTPSK